MAARIYNEGAEVNFYVPSFLRVIKSYIPSTIHKILSRKNIKFPNAPFFEENGRERVQELFDLSDGMLRMNGSAAEFCEQLKVYRNIPSDYLFFNFDYFCEPYSTTPIVYTNLKGEPYICKQDVFVHIQNMILTKFKWISQNFLVRAIICAFLKTNERALDGTYEFVSCSEESFKSIETDLDLCTLGEIPIWWKSEDLNSELFLNLFKTLVPATWDDKQFHPIRLLVDDTVAISSLEDCLRMYAVCLHLTESLQKIFASRPMIFKPYQASCGTETIPKIVRVFEDGGKKFIPKDEWPPSNICSPPTYNHFWEMLDNQRLVNAVIEKTRQFEVIRVPIIRAKYRTPIIRDKNGIARKLAVDMFFEILYEWILGVRLFQKLKTKTDWDAVNGFIFFSLTNFDCSRESIYFLAHEKYQEMQRFTETFDSFLDRSAKDVRDVGEDGFTEQQLVDELLHLELNDAFPSITSHAKVVYDHICKERKERVLRTCDLFDAIYHCQLIAFFKTYPECAKFIHNQNGCHRVLDIECACKATKPDARKVAQDRDLTVYNVMVRNATGVGGISQDVSLNIPVSNNFVDMMRHFDSLWHKEHGVVETRKETDGKIKESVAENLEKKNKKKIEKKQRVIDELKRPKESGNCEKYQQETVKHSDTSKQLLAAKQELSDVQKKEERHRKEVDEWKGRVEKIKRHMVEEKERARKMVEEKEKRLSQVEQELKTLRAELEKSRMEKALVDSNFLQLSMLNAQNDLKIREQR